MQIKFTLWIVTLNVLSSTCVFGASNQYPDPVALHTRIAALESDLEFLELENNRLKKMISNIDSLELENKRLRIMIYDGPIANNYNWRNEIEALKKLLDEKKEELTKRDKIIAKLQLELAKKRVDEAQVAWSLVSLIVRVQNLNNSDLNRMFVAIQKEKRHREEDAK